MHFGYDLTPIFIEFLSCGVGYPTTSVFYNKKALKFFKPKVSLEEMLATVSTYSKHQKYNANTQIIYHCLAEPNISIDDIDTLLAGDKQNFLVFLRIFSFGEKIKMNLQCPNCENKWDEEYNLIEIANTKKITKENMIDYNTFCVELPMSKQKIIYRHQSNLLAITPSNNKENILVNEIEEARACIVSIDDNTDQEYIDKKFSFLRVKDSLTLREHIKRTKPEITIFYKIKCAPCGFERTEELLCNNYFFQIFPEDYEKVVQDSYFFLGYYMGINWLEYLNIPIKQKYFLHERINKEIAAKHNNQGEAFDIPTKAPHDNTPEIRNLANKTKVFGSQNPRTQRMT